MSRWPFHIWLYLGVVLLLIGIQVRMMDVYVLSTEATAFLNNWLSLGGTNLSIALGASGYQAQYRPSPWLGYALLSAGAVLFANGWLLRHNRR
jgi:hypothetical protein